jgi:Trypsin-co-occurring domain 2
VVGDNGLVALSDAIGIVREQLVSAQLAGRRVVAGRVLTFAVGKVVIEFAGEVKKVVGGSGGLKFWIITADAKAERSTGATHRVSIELIPQGPDGDSFVVADGVDTHPTPQLVLGWWWCAARSRSTPKGRARAGGRPGPDTCWPHGWC